MRDERRGLAHCLLSLACMAALQGLAPYTAWAQADAPAEVANDQAFDIPAGALADALTEFGLQSGLQISYPQDAVRGLRSSTVKGRHRPSEALRLLLRETGMEFSFINASTVLVRPAARPAQPSARRPAANPATSKEEDIVGMPAIMVQGTRTLNMDITRTRDDPQPYVIFEREQIQQSGAQDLESFLRDRLPMNAAGVANAQFAGSQSGSQSTFNLRGLGANQTLILIDGHRVPPGPSYGTSPRQHDLNGIPMSAVERIEVLPATSSGIYGGGATGGVINVILRHDYTGGEVKVTYGNTFRHDVASRRVDLSAGFNLGDGKTNLLLMSSFSEQGKLTLGERAGLIERYYDTVRANAPSRLLPPNNPPLGATPNIRSADGSNLVLRDGTPLNSPITHIPTGYAGTGTDGGAALVANAGSYNLGLANSGQAVTGESLQLTEAPRNASLRMTLRREFSPRVQTFLEASANETDTPFEIGTISGTSLSPYRISASAPNNPFANDLLVTVPIDGLEQRIQNTISQHRIIGGAVVALGGDWKGAADYTWGRTRHRVDGTQYISSGADVAAILNGTLDILRDAGAFPAEDLAALMVESPLSLLQKTHFQDLALRFAGPVATLPGGTVNVSTLLEHRSERFSDTTQRVSGAEFFYPGRSADNTSLYVETQFPLVSQKNRRVGVEAFDVQLAVRADRYRAEGRTGFVVGGSNTPIVSARNETNSVNPTVALRYQPIEDLVIRTSYGTGFVPPDVSQLAPSVYPIPFTILDPQRGGTATTLNLGQRLYLGNPDLDPEESRNWSMGFIWTPRFAPGLRLSVDYLRIRKTDNIANYPTGPQGVVDDEALFPDRVQRGPNLPGDPAGWAGPITLLDTTLFNIASAEVEAVDLQLDYELQTRLGTFGLAAVATRQLHYRTTALAGMPSVENVGVTVQQPRSFSGNAELRWRHGGWTVAWLARHHGDYLTASPSLSGGAAAIVLQGSGGRVPSQTYHDLSANWEPDLSGRAVPRWLAGTEFQFNIRNVFDKVPPVDAFVANSNVFYSPLGDPLGASYQLAITKRF